MPATNADISEVRERSAPTESMTLGPVHLNVTDRDRALQFWSGLVGFQLRNDLGDALDLGTERDSLVVLHTGAARPVMRGFSGLYHVAIHLPNEPEFARVLARLIHYRWPIAPTDHIMSQAIYLDDTDGIGLELTLETPERQRSARFTPSGEFELIDAEGKLRSGRDPLDVQTLLTKLPDGDIAQPLPVGTFVGHMHLHVGDLDDALRFYSEDLGLIVHTRGDGFGYADMHAGGRFPHRMAVNTWQGRGASQPPAGSAGLRHFTVRFDGPERLQAALQRFAGGQPQEDGTLIHDPSGNAILLS
jgi:catechol 2,3-dioxygenase